MESLLFRETEIDQLEKAVTRTLFLADRLTIIGISGKAGVGKSLLTNHVLSKVEQSSQNVLRLSVNGSSTARRDDFFALIDKLTLAKVAGAKDPEEAFVHTRTMVRKHAAFATAVSDEMDRKNLDQTIKDSMLAMIRAGKYANRIVPHTKKLLNFGALDKTSEPKGVPEKELASLASFATREIKYLPSPFQRALGITFRNDLRRDPYGLSARELLKDLRRLVSDPELCDPEKNSRISRRFRRLVIVIDDFEALGACLSDFLFSSLLPLAKDENFGTVLVVVGRDDLSQSLSPSTYNQYQGSIKAEVSLEPFNRDQTITFLADNGIDGTQAVDIFEWSKGNPYLLSLRRKSKHNLNAARDYYKRGTQWMSAQQIEWFNSLVYLESVNIYTLGWLFDRDLAPSIQEWFEDQYDIRDVNADEFRVEPILRNQSLYYLSKHDPGHHETVLNKIPEQLGDTPRRGQRDGN